MTSVGTLIDDSDSTRSIALEHVVVLQGGDLAGAPDVAADELTACRLIEWAADSVEHARVADQVLDHGLAVRPVHLRLRREAPELLRRRRQPAVSGCGGRRADQHEREDPIGEVQRKELRQGAAGRDADDVGRRQTVRVEYTGGVGDKVGTVVGGVARLVRDRSAGVAVVVADHEAPAIGEAPTEAGIPPQHRPATPHDQQHCRVGRIAERLRAQVDAIHFDHPLDHDVSSQCDEAPMSTTSKPGTHRCRVGPSGRPMPTPPGVSVGHGRRLHAWSLGC